MLEGAANITNKTLGENKQKMVKGATESFDVPGAQGMLLLHRDLC